MRFIREVALCGGDGGKCAKVSALFDTGATHSLISPEALSRIPWARPIEHLPAKATVPGSKEPKLITESVPFSIRIGDCHWKAPEFLRVFDHGMSSDIVIGADLLEKMGFDFTLRERPEESILRMTKCPKPIEVTGVEMTWRHA